LLVAVPYRSLDFKGFPARCMTSSRNSSRVDQGRFLEGGGGEGAVRRG
jgi:hypothetical protein